MIHIDSHIKFSINVIIIHSRIAKAILTVLIICSAITAIATPNEHKMIKPLNQFVEDVTLRAGPSWGKEVILDLYGIEESSMGSEFANFITQIPVFSWGTKVANEAIRLQFENDPPKQIARLCKSKFSNDPWKQIACISNAVNQFINNRYKETLSNGLFSPDCRTFALFFIDTFNALNIPGSDVGRHEIFGFDKITGDLNAHVVNRITFRSQKNSIFAYIVDIAWSPEILYPLTFETHTYHHDNQSLPEIGIFKR